MKRYLKDQVGEIRKISMMELRSRPGEIIDAVETGMAFVICRNGKELAVLQRLSDSGLTAYIKSNGKTTYCPAAALRKAEGK